MTSGSKRAFVFCAALAVLPAAAQAAPLKVYFPFSGDFKPQLRERVLEAAIHSPDFQLVKTIAPDVLVIGFDGNWEYTDTKTRVQFTLTFTRDGDSIGQSIEICSLQTPDDCVAQIASDIKSAASVVQ